MPSISFRGNYAPESPIRKLVPYAEEAIRKGKKVYHLNIGQPDILTAPLALEAIKNMNIPVIEYTHSAGMDSFRREFAKFYQKSGINVTHNEIFVTTGASEAIIFTFLSCLNPGEEVIVPEPYYANYNGFAVNAGINIKPITSYIEDSFALPSMEKFEELITPQTRAILICNPNNPTGYLYSREELEQLKEICIKNDLYFICDEAYRDFVYDGNSLYSVLQMEGADDHLILIDSMSKRFSACGLRIGTLVTRNKDVIKTALKFGQARLCPPMVGQVASEAALNTSPEYFKQVYDEYVSRRDFIIPALNKIKGVFTPLPKGAFYTMVRLPVEDADHFCRWLLEEFDYNNETVMMAPASGFYFSKKLGKREVRIAYVLNKEDLAKAVKCLEVALDQYPFRTV